MGGVFGRWCSAGWLVAGALLASLAGCDNSPWKGGAESQDTLFSAMVETSPRHMDPTASYWWNDSPFTYQIYEPPYGYHYLKRPFELIPFAAQEIPRPTYYDKSDRPLPDKADSKNIAYSVYEIHIKPGFIEW